MEVLKNFNFSLYNSYYFLFIFYYFTFISILSIFKTLNITPNAHQYNFAILVVSSGNQDVFPAREPDVRYFCYSLSIKNDPTKLRVIFSVCCMVHPGYIWLETYLCSGDLSKMCYVPGDGRVLLNRVT